MTLAQALATWEARLGAPIDVRPARSRLRMSVVNARVQLAVPARAKILTLTQFLEANLGWLRTQIATQKQAIQQACCEFRVELNEQDCCLVFGELKAVHYDSKHSLVQLLEDRLVVGVDPTRATKRQVGLLLRNFLLKNLQQVAMQEVRRLSEVFPHRIKQLRISTMRSRWGSLSVDNKMSLNAVLAFAPIECTRYVVCHELAHTVERNHSVAFWRQVKRAMVDYEKPHRWLKQHQERIMNLGSNLDALVTSV